MDGGVLVVDDDDFTRTALAAVVSSWGYEVIAQAGGRGHHGAWTLVEAPVARGGVHATQRRRALLAGCRGHDDHVHNLTVRLEPPVRG